MTSTLTLNTMIEVRPLSKAPNPQLLPGRSFSGCVFSIYALGWFNAEHKFRVWVTTRHFTYFVYTRKKRNRRFCLRDLCNVTLRKRRENKEESKHLYEGIN